MQHGFTVLELAIALSLAGVVGAAIFATWTFTAGFTRRNRAELETRQFGRIALSALTRELREAPALPGAIAVWSSADGASVDAVAFLGARAAEDGRRFGTGADGYPIWQTAIYFVHDPSTGTLRRVAQSWAGAFDLPTPGEGRVVTGGVREIRFARQGDLVTVTLRLATGRRETTFETAILPRN